MDNCLYLSWSRHITDFGPCTVTACPCHKTQPKLTSGSSKPLLTEYPLGGPRKSETDGIALGRRAFRTNQDKMNLRLVNHRNGPLQIIPVFEWLSFWSVLLWRLFSYNKKGRMIMH